MKNHRETGTKARYIALDRIRGFTIASMILYHAAWDLVYLFGVDWGWYRTELAFVWQQSICWTFLLLSGFCCPLGKRQGRRGILVLAAGALVSAVTALAIPEGLVLFGVLTFLGSAMLLTDGLKKILRRVNPYGGLAASAALFFVTRKINEGYCGWGRWLIFKMPACLYQNMFTAYVGFPPKGFFSADYFPLLPWLFLFLAGYFLNGTAQKKGLLQRWKRGNGAAVRPDAEQVRCDGAEVRPDAEQARCDGAAARPDAEQVRCDGAAVRPDMEQVRCDGAAARPGGNAAGMKKCGPACSVLTAAEWLGRHSLIVYLLHQPVIYFVLWVVFSAGRA